LYSEEQRMVFGANTYQLFVQFERMLGSHPQADKVADPWVTKMRTLPATVVSSTLDEPLGWSHATLAKGDAVDVVARLNEESEGPLRSHGSVSMNRALLDAGLIDRLQLTIFPVITGQTRVHPLLHDAADFDLELIESRTFDGHMRSSNPLSG
jgi:dihydrofolate reductase